MRSALIAFLVVAGITLVSVGYLDREVAVLCRYGVSGAHYDLIAAFTDIGDAKWWFYFWAGAWIGAAILAARRWPAREAWIVRRRTAGFLFANMVAGGLVVVALKWGVGRYRPQALFEHGLYGVVPFSMAWDYITRSFPSGHAQTMFSLATPLALLAPRWRPLLFLFATAIALTRILMAVHYLSDVVAGAYLGTAMTYLVAGVYQRAIGPLPFPESREVHQSQVTVPE